MSGLPDRVTPVPQDLFEQTYGSSYICAVITVFLYGISVLQAYMYYMKYPRDSRSMKTLVFTLLVMGTVHTILICHTVYHYLVFSYTNPMLLILGEWSVYTSSILGAVMCFLIQVFFANMIFHLTKGAWRAVLAITFIVLSLAQLAFAIFFCFEEFKLWELGKLVTIVHVTMVPMLAFRIITDIFICVSLCYTLWDSRTEVRKTSKLINTLIVYAINRFVLTTVVVIVQMIVLISKPQSIGAMVIEFVTVHLYFNSLLATLNSRNHLRQHLSNGDVVTDSDLPSERGKASSVRFASNRSTIPGQQPFHSQAHTSAMTTAEDDDGSGKDLGVSIARETFIMSDLTDSIHKPGQLV